MLDCLGRELMIKRKYGVDENGWPGIFEQLNITKGQRVTITTDTSRECTNEVLPITYPKFAAMCEVRASPYCCCCACRCRTSLEV
jgi:pyruvate kinase